GAELFNGSGILRRGVAPRAHRPDPDWRSRQAPRFAPVRGPISDAARRRPAAPLLPSPRGRGRRPRHGVAGPGAEAAPRRLLRLPAGAATGRLVQSGTAARLRATRSPIA